MVAVIVVINNVLLGHLIWRNLFIRPKFDVVIRGDAIVRICEVDNYYHQTVRLLNTSQLDDHIIEVYVFNSACNSTTMDINVTKSDCSIEDNHRGNESTTCIIPLRFKIGKTCLVAYMYANFENSSQINLEAQVIEVQTILVLVTTLVPQSPIVILITILICCLCCSCRTTPIESRKYSALSDNDEALSYVIQ